MGAAYVLSPEAQQDIADIRMDYLKEADAHVTRYVLAGLTRAFRLLARTPGAGHSRSDLTEEAVKFWPVFALLVVYDPILRPVGIARVLHGHRDLAALFARQPPRA